MGSQVIETQCFHLRDAKDTSDGKPDRPPSHRPLLSPADYADKTMASTAMRAGAVDRLYCREIPESDLERNQKNKNIHHILPMSEDFRKEDTDLRRSSGCVARLRRTPRGYCELAGEGIEYCWGRMEKDLHKPARLDVRNFNKLPLESMSRKNHLLCRIRKFFAVCGRTRR
jgi:hypothetical protein